MSSPSVQNLIEKYDLKAHPEGGFFRETYRSPDPVLSERGDRSVTTAIYFLLPIDILNRFHRLLSDEMWHHYEGNPIRLHCFDELSGYSATDLGTISSGLSPQLLITRGTWFAAETLAGDEDYAFAGCTVSPGFDFADFEIADPLQLSLQFPEQRELIERQHRAD